MAEEQKGELEEDILDQELHKVDGWIRLRTDTKETKLDDFVAVCPKLNTINPPALEYREI